MMMSFQDLERGRKARIYDFEGATRRAVVAAVFKINTAVTSYKRFVNTLGTPKDTLHLRHKLRTSRLQIRQMVRETSAQLDYIREIDKFPKVDASQKLADAKITKDFEAILREFENAQLLAAEWELIFTPIDPDRIDLQPSSKTTAHDKQEEISSSNIKQQATESYRHIILALEDEITYDEALIMEREQDIRELQQQICEVNDIFQDLATLVREQGGFIDDISSNVEGSHAATVRATYQLTKACNIQRSTSSVNCLLLGVVGIILLVVVFMVVDLRATEH